MDIETFLIDLRNLFNDILISGVKYVPLSVIKKLRTFKERSRAYNLLSLETLIDNFMNDEENRNQYFTDISIWLDIAIIEYENLSV